MKDSTKNNFKALLTDLLFYLYLFSCLYYLINIYYPLDSVSYAFILLAAVFFTGITFVSKISLGYRIFKATSSKKWFRSFWGWSAVIAILITFTVGWNIVEVQPYKFFTGFTKTGGITSGIFDPSIVGYQLDDESFEKLQQKIPSEILEELESVKYKKFNTGNVFKKSLKEKLGDTNWKKYKDEIIASARKNMKMLNMALEALAETIFLAFLATVLAIPFAFVLSFFAARNLMAKTLIGNVVYVVIRTAATIFRSIEAIVWAIIFSVWVGIGPFAGMLALMIHSIAALTKLYSEQIENIESGPVEAIKATGASTLQTWVYAVIPQIISPYLAFTIYRWDINVRMATIVGFVGGGGIGLLLLQQQQLLRWHNVGLIIWLIAAVVWVMDMVSARVREKLAELN
ncbi:MAG: phosphonate ABC transporter, permease protein PhnE [Candidatus Cloacimonadota bacterium]|nr:phosphonate ABC transporter, permease protein PhnE [Candidatus Cloacimonadota bacterium]